jgi:hypothetical protein
MIDKAENKAIASAPRSKSEERRLAVQRETGSLEEFYFSASEGRPPVTVLAASFEEAVAEYNRRFSIPKP